MLDRYIQTSISICELLITYLISTVAKTQTTQINPFLSSWQ